jgi:hypothetical protein
MEFYQKKTKDPEDVANIAFSTSLLEYPPPS